MYKPSYSEVIFRPHNIILRARVCVYDDESKKDIIIIIVVECRYMIICVYVHVRILETHYTRVINRFETHTRVYKIDGYIRFVYAYALYNNIIRERIYHIYYVCM